MSGVPETEDQQRLRFQIELEFVQCLGNPNYLNCKYVKSLEGLTLTYKMLQFWHNEDTSKTAPS